MSMRLPIAATAAFLLCAGGALAQTTPQPEKPKQTEKDKEVKKLAVGDLAPPIQVEKWVKGEPITGFEKGRVYVVEFWATWCGPCVRMFPHLSELQSQYKSKGVTIVGVNIWEDARGTPYSEATPAKVSTFVEGQGDKMAYTVAYDGATKATDKSYMLAAGRGGIPSAFIVDSAGRVAWIGNPAGMDKPLEQIVAGTWDMQKAKAEWAEEAAAAEADTSVRKALMENRNDTAAQVAALEKLEKQYPKARMSIAQGLNAVAWGLVDPEGQATDDPAELALAMKAATRAVELTNEKNAAILDTLARVYFVKGDVDKAIEWQTKALNVASPGEKTQLQPALDEYKAAKNRK